MAGVVGMNEGCFHIPSIPLKKDQVKTEDLVSTDGVR